MKINRIELSEIVDFMGDKVNTVYGNIENVYIDNLADVAHTNATTLDWVSSEKNDKQVIAEHSKARVVLVDKDVKPIEGKVLIVVDNPKTCLAEIGNYYFVSKPKTEIHPTAIISQDAKIGKDCHIGPYCVIGNVSIGEGCVLDAYVRVCDDVTIGRCCKIKTGAVLGGEGFGFEKDEYGNRFRFPQIGGIIIGDNVEIGANTCIDRGALSNTVIEDYAKIDNLCHIAHNVHIGKDVVVVACSEISGSCELGDGVWTGPNCCIRDQCNVGKNTKIGMGAVVVKHVPENEVWAGNPARKFEKK